MKIFENVNAIAVKITLEGSGIVNFGTSDDKYFLNKRCGFHYNNDNNKIGKFNIYKNPKYNGGENGEPECIAIPKISADCLRHNAFVNDDDYVTNVNNMKLSSIEEALYLSSPSAIERGFLFAVRNGNSLRNKSAVTVTDAELTNNTLTFNEFHSNSSSKVEGNDTAIYSADTLGNTKWEATLVIDLKKCSVLIADDFGGRRAIGEELIENGSLADAFKMRYGRVPYTIEYVQNKNASWQNMSCEKALVFDNEFINFIIKDIIKRFASISIRTNIAYAETTSIKVKPICGIGDLVCDDNGYVEMSKDEIDEMVITPKEFYSFVDAETVANVRDRYAEALTEKKGEKKPKKAKKNTDDSEN